MRVRTRESRGGGRPGDLGPARPRRARPRRRRRVASGVRAWRRYHILIGSGAHADRPPPDALRRSRRGLLGGLVLGARSLIYGYASPAGNKPLVLSGRLREAAAPRLHETSKFVSAIVRPGGLRPGGEGWRISVRVRLMHAQVRRMIL